LLFRSRRIGRSTKVVLSLMWMLLGYNLWYTYGKAAYAFTLIGLGLVFVLGFPKRWHLAAGLIILAASVGGITGYGLWAHARTGFMFGTILTRYELWKAAVLTLWHDPAVAVFGNGFEDMTSLSAVYSTMEYPNAHNAYLNQAIYFGLPALALYAGAWSLSLRRVSRMLKKEGTWEKTAGIFFLSVMVALLGLYFFEPANQGVVAQAQCFGLLGLVAAISRMSTADGREHEEGRHLPDRVSAGL
jgi:cell division protein FtsW (lipid II flippase)